MSYTFRLKIRRPRGIRIKRFQTSHRQGEAVRKRKKVETGILVACLQILTCLENAGKITWSDRLNSGSIYTASLCATCHRWTKGYHVKLCREGTADAFVILNNGGIVWIETKKPGEKIKEAQFKFRKMVESAGHKYWPIKSTTELEINLKTIGIEI